LLQKKSTDFFESYKVNLKLDKVEAANTKQQTLFTHTDKFLRNLFLLKKELEQTYREFEKLYKIAEDILKTKEDKTWKELNKPKEIRLLLDLLTEHSNQHKNNNYLEEETSPVYFVKMAEWLQQRFPKATYEDVTGLCKLTKIADIEEQDYSLNPGRYVGVVIEEDGLTEEEFYEQFKLLNDELMKLNLNSKILGKTIQNNFNSFDANNGKMD